MSAGERIDAATLASRTGFAKVVRTAAARDTRGGRPDP
jgi:hypothetical protein